MKVKKCFKKGCKKVKKVGKKTVHIACKPVKGVFKGISIASGAAAEVLP